MPNLDQLPSEIISSIVGHINRKDLYACALVNKCLYALANPVLWRSLLVLDVAFFTKVIAGITDSQQPLAQHIHQLHFGSNVLMNDAMLLLVMLHVPHLEELEIHWARDITDKSITRLARHCPALHSLHLASNSSITHQSLSALAQHCPRLRKLCLIYTAHDTPSPTLLSHLHDFPSLDELLLEIGPAQRRQDARSMNEFVLDIMQFQRLITLMVLPGPPALTHLLLTTMDRAGHTPWPMLTNLCLAGCDLLTDRQAIDFFQCHPHLKVLSMESTTFSDAVLDAMATLLPDLQWIGLEKNTRLTHLGWRRLIWKCRRLRFAALRQCRLKKKDFPEADDDCSDYEQGDPTLLRHLNEKTMNSIRHGSEPPAPDENGCRIN